MQSTSEVRRFIEDTIHLVKNGEISNSVARTRLYAAKAYIDTLKVDIAVTQLGRELLPATFDTQPQAPRLRSQ
jgi:hypothetical protein